MTMKKNLKTVPIPIVPEMLTEEDLIGLTSNQGLLQLLKSKNMAPLKNLWVMIRGLEAVIL